MLRLLESSYRASARENNSGVVTKRESGAKSAHKSRAAREPAELGAE